MVLRKFFFYFAVSTLGAYLALSIIPVHAETAEELRAKIEAQNQKLAQLEKEIAGYQQELVSVGKQKQTLQQTVTTLDLSRKKIATDIQVTENKIDTTDLEIQELGYSISDKETSIDTNTQVLRRAVRQIQTEEDQSLIERLLSETSFSEMWEQVDALSQFQMALNDHVAELRDLKINLEVNKTETEQKKEELERLKSQLGGQKSSLDATRSEQNKLLQTTKNQEANFQKLLKEKQEAHDAFEQELREYESQLQFAIDPSKIPQTGSGILRWPVDSVYVTQNFGNTDFATKNPQVYSGKGHNGIDLRASIGTKIKAALSGVVEGTGNTDLQKGCYSYGKWVLIRHANGLSTLYAHLSTIAVTKGQQVETGEVIGYSGNTGYSTGPHLHFTVYSTQGVRIMNFGEYKAKTNCSQVDIPVASLEAYLNPLSYL